MERAVMTRSTVLPLDLLAKGRHYSHVCQGQLYVRGRFHLVFEKGPQTRDVQRAEAKITPQQASTVHCVELSAVPVPSRALLLCSLGIVL